MLYKLIERWLNAPSKKQLKELLEETIGDYEIQLNVHRKERIELKDENNNLKKSLRQVISSIDDSIEKTKQIENENKELKEENKKLKEKAEMLSEWNGELIERIEKRYDKLEISEMDKERYYRLQKIKENKENNNG